MNIEILKEAKQYLFKNHDVQKVGYGYKYVKGIRTDAKCISVTVPRKLPAEDVRDDRLVPSIILGQQTDVVEGRIHALSLTQRLRPCPPGYSIGHYKITAGTFGFAAYYKDSPDLYIYSNNHVLADSNAASIGDEIRQPGSYDNGTSMDRIATLAEYVKINFDGEGNGKKDKKVSQALWKFWKWPANKVASWVNCPYRLIVAKPHVVEQPSPNLVDLAWAKPVDPSYIKPEFPFEIGRLNGIRDLVLGDRVHKVGRTTEHTWGTVVTIDTMVKVSYGDNKIATFDDQLEIEGDGDPGSFSAGGDSGSATLTEDNFLGALLFAGSDSSTIVSPIRHVLTYGQFRLG